MYLEYVCYDYSLNEIETSQLVASIIKMGIKNIGVFQYSISGLKSILSPDISLSCPLDFPYGLSDIKSRNFLVAQACKSGASKIDIVIPSKILTNRKYDKLREDIRSNLAICEEQGVELRYILEYRIFSHGVLAKSCEILKSLGIKTVLPSSGTMIDDINDNLIVCNFLMTKTGIGVICNGNIYSAQHVEKIYKTQPQGVRLHHKNSVSLCITQGMMSDG